MSPPTPSDAPRNYRVYELRNRDGRRYLGLSADVAHRLAQHNDGASKWTAKFGPWSLFWQSCLLTLTEARQLENLMKRQKGGDGLVRIRAKYS